MNYRTRQALTLAVQLGKKHGKSALVFLATFYIFVVYQPIRPPDTGLVELIFVPLTPGLVPWAITGNIYLLPLGCFIYSLTDRTIDIPYWAQAILSVPGPLIASAAYIYRRKGWTWRKLITQITKRRRTRTRCKKLSTFTPMRTTNPDPSRPYTSPLGPAKLTTVASLALVATIALYIAIREFITDRSLETVIFAILPSSIAYFITAAAYLRWLYIVARNLRALGWDTDEDLPKTAIIENLLPVINLIAAPIMLYKIARASEDSDITDKRQPSAAPTGLLIATWWTMLAAALLTSISVIFFEILREPHPLLTIDRWLSDLPIITATLPMCIVINRISQNQDRRHRRIIATKHQPTR